jgi:GT2 family glycosyltransferase
LAAVIPHLDTPDETRRCVASLRRSRRPIDQIIVVDNGSKCPITLEDVTVVRAERNLGFSGGCNLGVAHAAGADAFLLVNSDAEIEADTVEKLEGALKSGVGIVGPAIFDMSGRVESMGVRFSRFTGRMRNLRRAGTRVEAVVGTCMLITREVLDRCGLLDERFFYGFEDLELCLRAAHHGFSTRLVPAAVAHHELAATIGRASPDRLYYAARNHLYAAHAAPLPFPLSRAREANILLLNLAHAIFTSEAPLVSGLSAVVSGALDYLRGRSGRRTHAGRRARQPL